MRTLHALAMIAAGGLAGAAAGVFSASATAAPGSALAAVAHIAHTPWHLTTRSDDLAARLQALDDRTDELATLQAQLDDLRRRVEGIDGGRAFEEARRLGIIDAVKRLNPDLRPSAVRRVGVAIVSEARKNSLDPLLLAAVARVESGFDPFATSDTGARGLLQLTPPTGRTLATKGGAPLGAVAELYDIDTNISLGARYLAALLRKFDSVDAALLAYNRGVGGARALLKSPEGRRALAGYPHAVLVERARLARRAAKLRLDTAL